MEQRLKVFSTLIIGTIIFVSGVSIGRNKERQLIQQQQQQEPKPRTIIIEYNPNNRTTSTEELIQTLMEQEATKQAEQHPAPCPYMNQ